MQLLLIGSGGREHALAWKLAKDPRVTRVFVAPGNAGTALEPKCENLELGAEDLDGLLAFALQKQVDLTLVGPEAPLVAGICDRFATAGLSIIGPSAAAARLEGSKCFSKQFMHSVGIPTATARSFSNFDSALEYLLEHPLPLVIKADGLAAGKGVSVIHSHAEGEAVLRALMLEERFGKAGLRLLIEAFLPGTELSYIVLADGEQFLPLASSQDHKPVGEGDTGLNTGGMGAYSPAPTCSEAVEQTIIEQILKPTLKGLINAGTPYRGFLYLGLMISPEGLPQMVEYNCRLGDPETQPILLRLESSLLDLLLATLNGTLDQCQPHWSPKPALGVVLASGGYPEKTITPQVIKSTAQDTPEQKLFYAGVSLKHGQTVATGGRVFCACALGETLLQAQQSAYHQVKQVQFEGAFYRRDIGFRALKNQSPSLK